MAVRPRPGDRADLPNPCPKEAAVLLLLYKREGALVLPFTRRTESLEMHSGQISLPGGTREAQDHGFAQTALRETCEELGIPADQVEVLASLSPLYIPPSKFCVYPHVGYARQPPLLQPDPREVAEVIEVPLERLLDPETRQVEIHYRDGQRFEVPAFPIGSHRIWGATGMIVAEFLAMLQASLKTERRA
jgi:8-oxo-dGTP pyrophosphatase MutT (NUDIX family)